MWKECDRFFVLFHNYTTAPNKNVEDESDWTECQVAYYGIAKNLLAKQERKRFVM